MSVVLFIIGGYIFLLCAMFLLQDKLIFLPSSKFLITPEQAGLKAEELQIKTDDGEQLHGWFFPHPDAEYVVILSHGNAGNISNRMDIAKLLHSLGFAIVLYDYRGYGKSTGKPGEAGFYKDSEAVYKFVNTKKGFPGEQIILYGRSMGGPVAAYTAAHFPVAGLVLDSTFKNLKAMVHDLYPFVPSALSRYEFPTEAYLKEISNIPVAILHSPKDDLIRISHGRDLFNCAQEPKQFVEVRGGHNNSFHASVDIHTKFWSEFRQTIDEKRKAGFAPD